MNTMRKGSNKIILHFAFACALLLLLLGVAEADYKNVYGDALQPCSQDGMALTGYTRTGYCVDQNDDSGSHHICIDLSTNTGGNFCEVTGQSDWCSSTGSCNEDASQDCQIQNWCVCQWAFASYLANAGGCDQIQDVVCDSINLEAVRAYTAASSETKYQNALDCLVNRCGLDLSNNALYNASGKSSASSNTPSQAQKVGFYAIGLGLVGLGVAIASHFKKKALDSTNPQKEQLVPNSK